MVQVFFNHFILLPPLRSGYLFASSALSEPPSLPDDHPAEPLLLVYPLVPVSLEHLSCALVAAPEETLAGGRLFRRLHLSVPRRVTWKPRVLRVLFSRSVLRTNFLSTQLLAPCHFLSHLHSEILRNFLDDRQRLISAIPASQSFFLFLAFCLQYYWCPS